VTEDADIRSAELAKLTAEIVSAFVSNNALPPSGLPDLIASVHLSLSDLGQLVVAPAAQPVPAVNPKKSVFPDYIICLEDRKKFKSLKRHLRTGYGLTPDEYRKKWNLPGDYPMVAPNYSDRRSALAKASGLGKVAAIKKTPAKRKAKAQ